MEYKEAAIAESWKGGGDPLEVPWLEKNLEAAQAKLTAHIQKMERDLA